MGLDMYLKGKKYHWSRHGEPEGAPTEDGFEIKETVLRLGYWRKHPNLHGYIVNEFADGKDDCQEIELSVDDLVKTLAAVEADSLPSTTGFFFGESRPGDRAETIEIFNKAIEWARGEDSHVSRTVVYEASW
jgi:hypothetical protein